MCNRRSKQFQTFMKEKERKYQKVMNEKIKKMKFTNPKEDWIKIHGGRVLCDFSDAYRQASMSHSDATV